MADPALPPLATLPPLLFAAAVSTYGLYLCRANITRLQTYESASKKAAEWSETAAQRLRKTRSTQASGTLALTLSFLPSTTLPFLPSYQTPSFLGITGLALGTALYVARAHMSGFWNERTQTKIPLVHDFNDAVRGSEAVVGVLEVLAFSWGVAGCVWALGWGGVGLGVWGVVVVGRGAWVVGQAGGGA
ncbi:hypothetical protein C7974DRAFT_358302 [Boeremia exigua]|uniref:uncharacterized protein n=1 Tax=Boeremia exigua TaxID=749465 RepID=UPI001E8DC569|nr:uncharacterized protein C7974DRAFT_358302 [Boeremia exigua]KAH6633703.1 hypothetical protein C7974DRAFT_358302 [Boeremia exigua]